MPVQWLLVGGPADGNTPFVGDDLREIRVLSSGIEHRYVGHRFRWMDDLFMFGLHSDSKPEDLSATKLALRLQDLGVASINAKT